VGVVGLSKSKKWRSAGYISISRSKSCVVIKVNNPETGGDYYIAEIPEVLEVLTKQSGYAKIYRK
jgi:hypothetical protein